MAKHGIRFKPEQIVSLLRQIEVLTANGKTLDEACKSLSAYFSDRDRLFQIQRDRQGSSI